MDIDKKEVLRYLGHKNQNIDENMDDLINQCLDEIKKYISLKYIFKGFAIDKREDGVKILNSNLVLEGRDIQEHLKDSDKCVIMAVTLGSLVDTKIRYYEKFNLTKALILDACATVAIENACDDIQEEVKKEAFKEDLGITYRYSPGYGDLPINIQKDILDILQGQKKIGLSATEDSILIPRKSVTAIIGFQDISIISQHPGCKSCSRFKNCEYKKGGNYCGD